MSQTETTLFLGDLYDQDKAEHESYDEKRWREVSGLEIWLNTGSGGRENNVVNPSINNHENKYIYLTTSIPDIMKIMSYSFKKTEEWHRCPLIIKTHKSNLNICHLSKSCHLSEIHLLYSADISEILKDSFFLLPRSINISDKPKQLSTKSNSMNLSGPINAFLDLRLSILVSFSQICY